MEDRITQRGKAATETRNTSRKACPEPSRRDAKAAKVGKNEWDGFVKIINLSVPNLAYFAPWRESIPVFLFDLTPTEVTDA